mmetsp:Transcript_7762/g.14088  ORF Transcript_7762/g.14088 Transcript_7762/m.14088 type:complete len:202 (+) Transcript_7762:46-651(+)
MNGSVSTFDNVGSTMGSSSSGSNAISTLTTILDSFSARLPSGPEFKDKVSNIWGSSRPWTEFANTSQMNIPSLPEAKDRITQNAWYYLSNYLVILLVLSAITILVSPLAILGVFGIAATYAYLFVVNPERIVLGNGKVIVEQRVKGVILAVCSLLSLWITGAGSTFATLLVVVSIISLVHILLRKPPDDADFNSSFPSSVV